MLTGIHASVRAALIKTVFDWLAGAAAPPGSHRQIKSAVRALAPATPAKDKTPRRPARTERSGRPTRREVADGERTGSRRFVSLSNCCRPRAMTRRRWWSSARQLRIHGVDLVNTGRTAGRRSMSALSASVLVPQQSAMIRSFTTLAA